MSSVYIPSAYIQCVYVVCMSSAYIQCVHILCVCIHCVYLVCICSVYIQCIYRKLTNMISIKSIFVKLSLSISSVKSISKYDLFCDMRVLCILGIY